MRLSALIYRRLSRLLPCSVRLAFVGFCVVQIEFTVNGHPNIASVVLEC